MQKFNVFQKNNLLVGTHLAIEIPSSSPELRAFVIIGSYIEASRGARRPSKFLNADHQDLRFWLRKYEITKKLLASNDLDIHESQLENFVYMNGFQNIETLEEKSCEYVDDFSSINVAWKLNISLFD
ncbi:hypothetical protein [Dictyobacter kobayashii]|uniref:Uncharacterized protein n=1 Tax=Dictyobacter kobayashii TaxID=2014872 RepID=A0A402AWU6_9CHLR|nr:hypothetical protein [Dictyobacter kobayashii]GCE23612.1 hypothetical protein KDK_74120 [Dictyobacter kobayashii]